MNVGLLEEHTTTALIGILVSQEVCAYISTLIFKALPSLRFMLFTLLSRVKENMKYSLEHSKALMK